ncbi:DUF4232 domain-containing protein [Mycobacterium sp. 1274761.0]|uniref:DUF4232 domain-containing protein n=1 Tax=Mycobacterium sp. 1274761.0 TaxID=1834077 RepID=UPI0007FFBDB9|nr:DUF4232 domain-containing protein [Mycobacterium sp. 1274761.0]OBK74676.1 hypothetical protein A5651_09405 [Mycobacterium sp. 1274761.0]
MKLPSLTMLTAAMATTVVLPVAAHADIPQPCSNGQVQVSNGGQQAASGHREVVLFFSLAPGAADCTVTGYPGVDTGAGGPLIHADRRATGFMGGLRDTETPPTVTITATSPGRAVVEGAAADRNDPNRSCPTYTELSVTAPDTTDSMTVPVDIDSCTLQVHPVESLDAGYHEHTETASYTIDIGYPLDYPDRKGVSDFVSADRAEFVEWVAESGSGRHYTYDVDAKTYRSASPATTTVVLSIDDDTGAAHAAHPATSFESFTFDLTKHAPVTFDTVFTSTTGVIDVLTPLVRDSYGAPMLDLHPSDCQNFALTDDAVIFFFGEGQLISADNTGPRQVPVRRSELAPLMA